MYLHAQTMPNRLAEEPSAKPMNSGSVAIRSATPPSDTIQFSRERVRPELAPRGPPRNAEETPEGGPQAGRPPQPPPPISAGGAAPLTGRRRAPGGRPGASRY